jgi:Asp/Glu/hydantoin racemase
LPFMSLVLDGAVAIVGFLHTAAVHVPTFQTLLAGMAPGLKDVHVVDETLLNDARRRGVNDDVRARLQLRLRELVARDCQVVLCSCSTLGGAAEDLGDLVGVPVVRIDRPMAERAVATNGRIGVVVAVESTLTPTRELLEQCVAAANSAAVLIESPCLDAWGLFEAGNVSGYVDRLVGHVRELAPRVDVVVLGQASMAPAVDLLDDLHVPVLCSPRLGVARAVELVSERAAAHG